MFKSKKKGLTLCNLFIMFSLYSELPSIIPVTGFENHSLNSLWDWKTCGIKKCIKDQSSIRLFCKGVPVNSNRLRTKQNYSTHLWEQDTISSVLQYVLQKQKVLIDLCLYDLKPFINKKKYISIKCSCRHVNFMVMKAIQYNLCIVKKNFS